MVTLAEAVILAIAVLLLVLSALLAAAETSLSRIDPVRARYLAKEERRGAKALLSLTQEPKRFASHLNSVLFLQLTAQIVAATLVALLALRWLDDIGVVAAVVVEILVGYMVAQALPKTWAIQHTDRAALATAPFIVGISRLLPMQFLTGTLIRITNVLLPGDGLAEGPFVYEQHMLALADSAAEHKEIEREDHRLIQSVMQFGTTIAREIMVPRPDMVTLPADTSADEAIDFAITNGFSRIPVRGDDQDEILGLLLTKEVLRVVHDGRGEEPVRNFLREFAYVPETKRAADLMREMQLNKTHMVLVVDEYGSTVGLITLEDLIEELVGDISDEHDAEERPAVERVGSDEWSIDARMPIDDVYEELELSLPHGDWDTVGGLLINAFGRVPSLGEETQIDDLRFTVEETSDRRVTRVRLLQLSPQPSASDSDRPVAQD